MNQWNHKVEAIETALCSTKGMGCAECTGAIEIQNKLMDLHAVYTRKAKEADDESSDTN